MQVLRKEVQIEAASQFEITSNLLRNLYKFNLTPITKLVLLELTTHLNENKNGSVVFPSVGYIAEVLGIGLTAAKKAISDLIKEGLIIKSKRGNIRGNYNKYLLTPKMRNSTSERSESESFKQSDSDLFLIETNKQEKINNKEIKKQPVKNTSKEILGGNVYSGDDAILYEYAKTRATKSVAAYIRRLKETGSAKNVIKEYKRKNVSYPYSAKQTEILRGMREISREERTAPETCEAWVNFAKKYGIKK